MSSAGATLLRRFNPRVAIGVTSKRALGTAASKEPLMKTALNDFHKEFGGDMVPFAGYELPVLYKGEHGGVMKEHLWCRENGKAALFDVSHMGQVRHRTYNAPTVSIDIAIAIPIHC